MDFTFDEAKSRTNRKKHGIDFIAAQALWLDDNRVEVPARTEDEHRFLIVGLIAGKHWSAVVTYRDERIRIVSVRRARQDEIEHYESK
jgi:uncharacterized protein